MDNRKFVFQNKYITLQRMNECYYFCFCVKKDTLLQRMDGCSLSGEINSLSFKTSNA